MTYQSERAAVAVFIPLKTGVLISCDFGRSVSVKLAQPKSQRHISTINATINAAFICL